MNIGSKFLESSAVINSLSLEKLPLLLGRILQKLHLRNTRIFSEEEEEQLRKVFDLSMENLNLVLSCCSYIFEQSAFAGIGPDALLKSLVDANIDEDHAKVICRVWAAEALSFVSKLKNRSLGSTALLDTDYKLVLTTSENTHSKLHDASSIFELKLGNSEKSLSSTNQNEILSIEFDHSELYDFFCQLERVQQQLDQVCGN